MVDQSYSIYSTNVVVVSKASLLLEGLPLGGSLPQNAGQLIEQVPGVSSVTPMLIVVDVKQLIPSNITIGIPLQNFTMFGNTVHIQLNGAYPASDNQIVVGQYLAKTTNLQVGSIVEKGNTTLQVSGIMVTANLILDNSVIMPLETAQITQGYQGLVSAFLVSGYAPMTGGDTTVSSSGLISSINSQIPGIVAMDPKQSEFLTNPLVSSVNLINGSVETFSGFVAILFVVIISMVNITEQKDEFLTMRSIGSSSFAVIKIATAEGAFLATIGVLLGSLLATIAIGLVFQIYASIPFSSSVSDVFHLVPLSAFLYSSAIIIAIGIAITGLTAASMIRKFK